MERQKRFACIIENRDKKARLVICHAFILLCTKPSLIDIWSSQSKNLCVHFQVESEAGNYSTFQPCQIHYLQLTVHLYCFRIDHLCC